MKWEAFHWTQSQPLAEDYNHHFTRVQELYDFNPWEEGSLQRRADWVRSSGTAQADRAALIQALKEYNHRLNQPPEALRAVEALESPDALAVVGGQQAGLFGGPLLVLYKAITILQVAKQAADQLSCPVIPVFG
ncbi:bacillithiol biosynthesis BshC [Paenibacillus larvae]|nr:bacillithiol biosynthesis BshC [Paenibacillus larvae]MDT2265779.1 bacillithiol biosynthesis BshC [Paenibacillus larvae]MDT2277028.1 bacillithiol biosynthesis BshC [Paenibacillus larvae]